MDNSISEPQDESNPEDTEELHREITKNIKESRRHFFEWREEAKSDYEFYAGHQWNEDDAAILEEQGRPAVTFNRVARTINSVAGLEVQNRQEVRYFPRQVDKTGASETLSGAAKWVRDECDAEDEESEAFQDALICGMGWTESRLDYEIKAEGNIIIERCDPLEMGCDDTAKKRNIEDSRFRYRIKSYSISEFKERWPGNELPQSRFFDAEEDERQVQDLSPGSYSPEHADEEVKSVKQVQICQYQYYELTKVHMVQGDDGKMVEMPADQFKQRLPIIKAKGWKYTKQARNKRTYYQCFLTPNEILERELCPINDFTFHCMTGLRDRNENTWFGLVRLMKDPQMWANKWLSQIQHILNTNAKSGKVLFESGAFKNPAKAKAEWSSPDAMAELNAGGKEKIEIVPGAPYPDGIDRLLQYAMSAIHDVPGVNLELMGLANRDQANVLEESRKQAGVTILAIFFDTLRRYRKKQGRALAEFIRGYISDGRLIRISGPLGPQYIPLIRDPETIDYDVVVDDAPSSPNMKEKTFAALAQIMPMILQEQIPVPPDVLDYTPLPEDLTQKWKQYIEAQGNNPEVKAAKQLANEAGQAEVALKKAQADLNAAKAQRELAELQKPTGAPDNSAELLSLHLKDQQSQREMAQSQQIEANKLASQERIELAKILVQAETQRMIAGLNAQEKSKESASVNDNQAKAGKEMGSAMIEATRTQANAFAEALKNITQGNAGVADAMKMLAEVSTKPKETTIKRDKSGKAQSSITKIAQ